MDNKVEFKKRWKVFYKRGEGEAVVYAHTEKGARNAALAAYRKRKTMVDFCSVDDIVNHIEYMP